MPINDMKRYSDTRTSSANQNEEEETKTHCVVVHRSHRTKVDSNKSTLNRMKKKRMKMMEMKKCE